MEIQMVVEFLIESSKNIVERYRGIVSNGFDEGENHPVKLSHFIPCNQWEQSGDLYLIDKSTGDEYFHDSPRVKRLKCLALVAATPIVHAVGTLLNVANKIAKLVTFSHFWHPDESRDYSFGERFFEFGKDLLRVAFSPMIYVGLELSAIHGLMLPYDGGKLYATFERCAYDRELAAPCFQPSPTSHLGGGDVSTPDNW
jgi:hypothetical protein